MVDLEKEHAPQVQQEVDDAESEASTSSFDLVEEPDNESDPDYNPSRDHLVVSGVDLSRLHFEPRVHIAWSDWIDSFFVAYDII